MRTSAGAREITSGMAGPPQVVCGSGPCGPLTTAIVQPARDATREDQPHASILTNALPPPRPLRAAKCAQRQRTSAPLLTKARSDSFRFHEHRAIWPGGLWPIGTAGPGLPPAGAAASRLV